MEMSDITWVLNASAATPRVLRGATPALMAGAALLMWLGAASLNAAEQISFTVTPAATGPQLIRTSRPLPRGFLRCNDTALVNLKGPKTCDPRMKEALDAQVAYAAEHLHVNRGECRNIGDVRDFIRLYRFTGEQHYLAEALRLFREFRPKLSSGHLFDQGGKPLAPDPPFIDEDQRGLKVGYAKPDIIGYALAGLPDLLAFAPDEPDLRETVRAVADFLAVTVAPVVGWRYPHPRSSGVTVLSQGLEHAARDYREGKVTLASAPPEGLVYFAEVLTYYLQHRPVARLLVEPQADEPPGQMLNRIPRTTP